jgi:hypothetical protein
LIFHHKSPFEVSVLLSVYTLSCLDNRIPLGIVLCHYIFLSVTQNMSVVSFIAMAIMRCASSYLVFFSNPNVLKIIEILFCSYLRASHSGIRVGLPLSACQKLMRNESINNQRRQERSYKAEQWKFCCS